MTRTLNIDIVRDTERSEEDSRKLTLSFSSEEPYRRWFGMEILSHDPGAVDLTRLNEIGIVLFNHDRDKILGKVLKSWIENNRGMAEIEFDDDELAESIRKKVLNKTLKGVSVGYSVEPDAWEEVPAGKVSNNGRFNGPCSIATRWQPFEISLVSVPADASVGVGRSDDGTKPTALELAERQLKINNNLYGR